MTDPVIDLLEEAASKLEEACRDYRFKKNDQTDLKDHELYYIEWRFQKPLDKFIAEVES